MNWSLNRRFILGLTFLFLSCMNDEPIETLSIPSAQTNNDQQTSSIESLQIFGGQKSNQLLAQYVVRLDIENEKGIGTCTGSLLQWEDDPDRKTHIVTAAHCFNWVENNYPSQKKAVVLFPDQNGVLSKQGGMCYVKLPPLIRHQRPSNQLISLRNFNEDLAIVEIDPNCKVPERIKTLPILERLHPNGLYQQIGYGLATLASKISSVQLIFAPLQGNQIQEEEDVVVYKTNKESGICVGDSGGPLIFQEQHRLSLIGTLGGFSTKKNNSETDITLTCSNSGELVLYTNISHHIDWINTRTKQKVKVIKPETPTNMCKIRRKKSSTN